MSVEFTYLQSEFAKYVLNVYAFKLPSSSVVAKLYLRSVVQDQVLCFSSAAAGSTTSEQLNAACKCSSVHSQEK